MVLSAASSITSCSSARPSLIIKTLYRFAERGPRLYTIICEKQEVQVWLKGVSFSLKGTNTHFVLDDCAASKDVKRMTGELVELGFSARHAGISAWVLTT